MHRIRGIDSIRFICAMVVVIDHYGLPLPQSIASIGQPWERIINGLIGCMFNGPAAVIVFFLISGFCIHFPYHNSKSFNLPSYYSRRIIRICLPALVAISLYSYLGLELKPPLYHVFWSVICELIYYMLYPLFFLIKNKLPFYTLTIIAYIIAFTFSITHLEAIKTAYGNYGALGWFTWVIGLPCWLTGCWLAENYQRFSSITPRIIWLLRVGVFGVSILLKIVRFHVDSVFSSYVFILTPFALLVCLWLGYEIMYHEVRRPSVMLERAGRWSYSLYIVHPTIPTLLVFAGFGHVSFLSDQVLWTLSALLVSYIFFLLIEQPGHKLAVTVSTRLKTMTTRSIGEPETIQPTV